MIGTTVSHYEILGPLGSGGMGVVYRARDIRLDRVVALKFLPDHSAEKEEPRARFMREARAASQLDHPAIAVIHEVDETEDGRIFIAMACYEGETIKDRLARGPMEPGEAIRVATAVGEGLAAAHAQSIVHRDIKPANVFLTRDGGVKILDFGLAKQQGGGTLTLSGDTLGTAAYMSPEQITGEAVDQRTDIWSLGVMLHEMVSGAMPFAGGTIPARLHGILHDPPEPLDEHFPEALRSAVGHALEKDPDDRYPDATAMLDDLRRAEAGERPTATHTPTERRTVRNRWARAAGVALATGAIAAIAWIAWSAGSAGRGTRPSEGLDAVSLAVLPLENLTGDPERDYLAKGLSAGLVRSLSEISGLNVVGRSVAWGIDSAESPEDFAQRLGVQKLLEGDMQGENQRLRIAVNLLEAGTGVVLWSRDYQGDGDSLLALQHRIAEELTALLEVHVSPHERNRLEQNATESFRAYDLYLRGEQRGAERDFDEAIALLEQATQTDPEFALAYAARGEALWRRFTRSGDAGDLDAAEALVQKALDLDDSLPEAVVAHALVLRSRGRLGDSLAEARRALATHPKPALAQIALASTYEMSGDLEGAEQALRTGTALAPEDWFQRNVLGTFLMRVGAYADAATELEKAAALAPEGMNRPAMNRAALHILQGEFDLAIEAFERLDGEITIASVASNLGTAYYFSDRPDKWEQAEQLYLRAAELSPDNHEVRRNLGDLYVTLERPQEAADQYREARSAVQKRLATQPGNADLRLFDTLYAAKAADCDDALAVAAPLASDLPETGPNLHDLAMVHALCDAPEAAATLLQRALDLGFPAAVIEQEDEFASVRDRL